MRAHLAAITALLAPLGYPVHLIEVPVTPTYPYLLLWSSGGAPGPEQAVDDVRLDIDTTVGVTMVGVSPEAVLIVQPRVRAVLVPGGLPRSLTVASRSAVLRLADSRQIDVDRDVTLTSTDRHPAFGVDLYRLISTPA